MSAGRRITIPNEARDCYRAMAALDRSIEFDARLRELVKIRASTLNGCAYCIDMHTLEARRMGEGERRLHALAAWRESPLFDERERAALALTDAITRLPEGGVPDADYDAAASEFGPAAVAQLIMAIVAINAWNRIAVSTGIEFEPGDR